MKVVALITDSPSCERIWKSLESVGHDVTVIEADGLDDDLQWKLIWRVRTYAPDFAIFVGGPEGHIGKRLLTDDVLRKIAAVTPFIHLCCDGSDEPWHPQLNRYATIFRLQVNMDGCEAPGCIPWLELMDEREFHPLPWKERDIKFGMSGGFPKQGRRADFMTALQEQHGLQVFKGNDPYAKAAEIMCRIKVMFDHGMRGSGNGDHCNCRIIEAGYAGCALFENEETPLDRWMVPGVHYFPYRTVEDVAMLLTLPDEYLQASARALQAIVIDKYSPRPSWDYILKKAGVQ